MQTELRCISDSMQHQLAQIGRAVSCVHSSLAEKAQHFAACPFVLHDLFQGGFVRQNVTQNEAHDAIFTMDLDGYTSGHVARCFQKSFDAMPEELAHAILQLVHKIRADAREH